MAASPVITPGGSLRRRPLALTPRRLEANRRNAARSTGPRTAEGKARVARNPIKHGFFVVQDRWTVAQQRDFEETLEGLREDFRPQDASEDGCVKIMAQSYARMAVLFRYENIAALKYHQRQDREIDQRIATADAPSAARLAAQREKLRNAGMWRPTIPGPREAMAIGRYAGRLDRAIQRAHLELQGLKIRRACTFANGKTQKQTHFAASAEVARLGAGPPVAGFSGTKLQKQTHFAPSPNDHVRLGEGPRVAPSSEVQSARTNSVLRLGEGPRVAPSSEVPSAETNPLSSMFTGNRHERRRARALAARRR